MSLLAPWITRLFATSALALSGYLLAISATTATAVGCDWSSFDCEAALASPWAKWFGVPVAAGGVFCYLMALVGSLLAGRKGSTGSWGWRLLELATPLAVGAGLWFTFVQATRLESFCLYCVLTHACGLMMAIAAISWRFGQDEETAAPLAIGLTADGSAETPSGPPTLGLPTIAGVVGVLALAVGQTLWAPSTVIAYQADLDTEFTFDTPDEAPATPSEQDLPAEPQATESGRQRARHAPRRRANGSRPLSLCVAS